MARQLDLADIQGGILRDYGGDFPKGRFLFLHIPDGSSEGRTKARAFVEEVRGWVTTAVRWGSKAVYYPGKVEAFKPEVTFNIGFTFYGLYMLDVPTRTLKGFPDEYIDGMAARAHVLGDVDENGQEHWDEIWKPGARRVHISILIRAKVVPGPSFEAVPALDAMTTELFALAEKYGLEVLSGHRGLNDRYQDASAFFQVDEGQQARPVSQEHFGYTDAISEVVFDEQGADLRVRGGGKISLAREWEPHATGEFLLGHPDEAQELPPTALPPAVMRNGTFLAYRKLHQNVKTFEDYAHARAGEYAGIYDVSRDEAREIVTAKMIGRWKNGVPLVTAPTPAERDAFMRRYNEAVHQAQTWKENAKDMEPEAREAEYQTKLAEARRPFIDFRYADDRDGTKCPLGAHIRRTNTRDMLDTVDESSILNNRRRILRRGLPYGPRMDKTKDDEGEHGVVFLAYCASLFRQFEFVQQQWLQYGLDFNAGNDRCPLTGNRVKGESHKFVIPTNCDSGKPPFICADLPQFVQTRGGEYFFMPSMTALRMIAMGTVDPT